MKKLIQGIINFRQTKLTTYRQKFARLAIGQAPDALFIACSDSRVVPNLFASTDPGDLFVIRNVGNLVPCCTTYHHVLHDGDSVFAALEFSLTQLHVNDIIICGHSECGAMQAVLRGRENIELPHLRAWLQHAEPAYTKLKQMPPQSELAIHNQLSQVNVITQMEHLQALPLVQKYLSTNQVKIHGWWFDLATADVYRFDEETKQFILID